jgi:hypothetical protein
MNKKDRIAVVTTFAALLLILPDLLKGIAGGVLIAALLFSYWSYRFIKNDISFLKVKDD